MRSMRTRLKLVLGIALCCATAITLAAEGQSHGRKYKWKDGEGNVHYADTLPSEALQFGYDVINADGMIVKHVERAKTAEELKAESELAARQAAEQKLAEEQAARDQQILAAYATEDELVKSQRSRIDAIDQSVHSTELSLANQEKSLTEMLNHAANLDRSKPVPATVQQQIDSLRQNIEKQKSYITQRQDEKTAMIRNQAAELAHYRELRARQANAR